MDAILGSPLSSASFERVMCHPEMVNICCRVVTLEK